jgi:hypothetical protein
MKLRKTRIFFALLIAACTHASAQSNKPPVNEPDYKKPKIFADLPDRMNLRLADAEALLSLSAGEEVNATLGAGFTVKGVVVSKSNPADPSVQTVVIRTANRKGLTFTFTRVKNADRSFSYRGRMLGKDAGDALEIVKEDTAYVIRKKTYYDLVNE